MDAGSARFVARMVARAGGQTVLARLCGISPQAVQQWVADNRVPPLRVLECERLSGIPRWKIRPDLYPPPQDIVRP
jgi:DNA-binding transcriptional regulator YdaS (Cro superfamily)